MNTSNMVPAILVGDAPEGKDSKPFGSIVGRRLSELIGVEHVRLREAFQLMTLLDVRPAGSIAPLWVAQHVGSLLRPRLAGRQVLFYGRAVAAAFGCPPGKPLTWNAAIYSPGRTEYTYSVLPDFNAHADPIWSAWWNDATNVFQAVEFLQSFAHPRAYVST